MAEGDGQGDGKSTEWNQAIQYLQRLDEILKFAAMSQHNNNYKNWWKAINSFYNELYPWLEIKEIETANKLIDPLYTLINIDGYDEFTKYKKFLMAERYLRTKMHDKGMDLPKKKKISDIWRESEV